VELAVGDWVVYAGQGTARVAARERRTVLGVEQEVVVLELANGLSVTLPVQRARERLRPVVGEAGVRLVQQTLAEGGEINPDSWTKRLRQGQEKLIGGDLLELAEIVRDGALRERTPTLAHSETERRLYAKARHLLAQEIGCACGLDEDEADAWIEEQLAKNG
jgi:CarD family transcriptional regulator